MIYIMAVIALSLIYRSNMVGESNIGTEAEIAARTRPVGQVRIATQTDQGQMPLLQQDDENKAADKTDIVTTQALEKAAGVAKENVATVEKLAAEALPVKQEISPPVAPAAQAPGKGIYDRNCASCHESGTENAPVTGDQNAFLASFSKGIDVLTREIKQGQPLHPKIGWAGMTDVQVTNAINYILEQTFWPNTSR